MPVYRPRATVLLSFVLDDSQGLDSRPALESYLRRGKPYKGSPLAASIAINPESFTVERNTIRKADTFDVTFDYLSWPLDPRAISSMRVAIHMWDSPDGRKPPLTRDTLVGIGYVDVPETRLAAGSDKIILKGRDYTGVFLDKKVPTDEQGRPKEYNLDKALLDVVLDIVADTGDWGKFIANEFNFHYRDAPSNHPVWRNLATVTGNPTYSVSGKDDLWTLMSQICDMVPAMPYFDLDRLRVERVADVDATPYMMAYGSNLERLTYKKDFNAGLTRPIELRCYNDSAASKEQRVVIGSWPDKSELLANAKAKLLAAPKSGEGGDGEGGEIQTKELSGFETTVIHLQGDYSQEELQQHAKELWTQIRRRDIQGTFETSEMVDLGMSDYTYADQIRFKPISEQIRFAPTIGTSNKAGDLTGSPASEARTTELLGEPRPLTNMKNGDVVILGIDRSDWRSIWNMGDAEAMHELSKAGNMSLDSAAIIVRAAKAAGRRTLPLYVKRATHKYDADDGYSLSVDFTSFIGTDLED